MSEQEIEDLIVALEWLRHQKMADTRKALAPVFLWRQHFSGASIFSGISIPAAEAH